MPSSYTNLLGLVLPTTGELNGTWGSVLNSQQTQLVEDSVAGYATADVTAGDWTPTTTGGGAANQARMAILIATGTPGTTRNIFVPKQSKVYVVVNNTNAAITVRGGPSSPTTGVSVPFGTSAVVAWDTESSDFVAVSGTGGGGGGATGGGEDAVFVENDVFITTDYTIGENAQVAGAVFSNGSAVVSFPNSFVAGQPVYFDTTGALPTNFSTGTVYYVIATGLTSTTFQVSTTVGGSAITAGSSGSGVQSCGKVKNAESAGPIALNTGVIVTVPTGSVWSIV